MIAMQELGVPHDKINVNGGACATRWAPPAPAF